jgi:hypothetical protein
MNKVLGESFVEFEERKKFFQKLLDNKVKEDEAIKLSLIWANIKFRKCRYEASLYHQIKKYDDSV